MDFQSPVIASYVLVIPKRFAHCIRLPADLWRVIVHPGQMPGFKKEMEEIVMTQQGKQTRAKGGRPAKDIRKSTLITLKCTAYEKMVIEEKAREANLTTSEYVREISLRGVIERKVQTVPVEILSFKNTLNHMAANLNQIARRRNSFEQLSDTELADLRRIVPELKEITHIIKNHLQ